MQTFKPIEEVVRDGDGEEIKALSYIVAELIPHVVALALLAAAIPVTQKLGAAGSSKIIGGAAGLGKVAVGTYAGIKLAGGLGKKVGGGTAGRAHSGLKGGLFGEKVAKEYNKAANKVGGALKSSPIGGRIFIKHESDKAERNKEAVGKHEKVMDNLTDKDKKKYVDSFKLDKNAQAEAKQAMFNVLAKDNGAGLTNKNLQKMGYEKEVAGKKVFDEEKFNEDYGQVVAHGNDTSKIETYRPDLINDKADRLEKIDKIAADGNEKSIKLATLADPEMDARLRKEIGNTRYNNLINSKSQAEKDDLAKIKEDQIIKGIAMHKTNPSDKEALDITDDDDKEEILKKQIDIAYLTGTKGKAEKMKKIKGIDSHLDIEREDDIDPEIARKVVNKMNTDELVDQDPQFLEDTSHMIKEPDQFRRMNKNKNITTGQSEAIKRSIDGRMGEINAKTSRTDEEKDEYERLKTAADIMGSSITKADKKKKSSGSGGSGGGGKDKNKRGGGKDQSTFDNFGGEDEEETVSTDLISNKSRRSILKDESTSMDSAGGESSDTDDEQSFLKEITEVQKLRNKNKEKDEDQKYRNNMPEYRETVEKLEELAGKEGLGINISGKKEHSIGVPSFGISKVGYSKDGEKKESTIFTEKDKDEVFMDPKTISNIKELFKTDKKFGEGGMTSIMEHEKQHLEGQASKSAKKEESELKKYSKKKGVSFEDVKKKKDELHDKYYAGEETQGAGYELQTEVQRGIKGFKDVNDFVESKARMQVVTDVVHGGMDNLGKMKYGSEDPGFDDTHSRFIKQDVLDKITERMEVMRQGLVAKHEARKDGDSGDDETTVEGGDDFMTGSGKGNLESETKKNKAKGKKTKSEKIRKAYLKTNIAIGEADKIALKTIGKVRKDVGLANEIVIPAIDKGIEVNKRKLADPNLTNKQIRKEEIEKVKGVLKPIVSKNADKGVDAIGDGAEEALNKAAENATGKTKIALKTASAVAGNKHVRRAVSKKAKRLADQDEGQTVDKKPITKPNAKPSISPDSDDSVKKDVGAKVEGKTAGNKVDEKPEEKIIKTKTVEQPRPKQQETKETKPETIVKTKSAPVVKTEITSKSNVGREMSEQIRKALEEVSRDMKQEITNNIAVNSSQEAVDIDFEKIIDVNKIAELVEKGIDMKDVEKNLKDVKKSFDKFKENNSGNADTTVFGAGISVARAALNEAQNREDHKEQAVELATIENVLGEIKSEMKKQDKSSIEEEK